MNVSRSSTSDNPTYGKISITKQSTIFQPNVTSSVNQSINQPTTTRPVFSRGKSIPANIDSRNLSKDLSKTTSSVSELKTVKIVDMRKSSISRKKPIKISNECGEDIIISVCDIDDIEDVLDSDTVALQPQKFNLPVISNIQSLSQDLESSPSKEFQRHDSCLLSNDLSVNDKGLRKDNKIQAKESSYALQTQTSINNAVYNDAVTNDLISPEPLFPDFIDDDVSEEDKDKLVGSKTDGSPSKIIKKRPLNVEPRLQERNAKKRADSFLLSKLPIITEDGIFPGNVPNQVKSNIHGDTSKRMELSIPNESSDLTLVCCKIFNTLAKEHAPVETVDLSQIVDDDDMDAISRTAEDTVTEDTMEKTDTVTTNECSPNLKTNEVANGPENIFFSRNSTEKVKETQKFENSLTISQIPNADQDICDDNDFDAVANKSDTKSVNNTECPQIVIVNTETNEKVNNSSRLALNSTSKQNISESLERSTPKPTKITKTRINTPLLEDNAHDDPISELTKISRGAATKIRKIIDIENSSNITSHEDNTIKPSIRPRGKSFSEHNARDNIISETSKRLRSSPRKIEKATRTERTIDIPEHSGCFYSAVELKKSRNNRTPSVEDDNTIFELAKGSREKIVHTENSSNVKEKSESLPKRPKKQKANMWTCKFCFQTHISKKELFEHRKEHLGEEKPNQGEAKKYVYDQEREIYICNNCSAECQGPKEIEKHVKAHEKKFNCYVCKEELFDPINYTVHVQKHREDKMFPCPWCQHVSHKIQAMQVHINRLHLQIYDFQCTKCGKCFNDAVRFKDHVNVHLNLMPFRCVVCSRHYYYSENLLCHQLHTHTVRVLDPESKTQCNDNHFDAVANKSDVKSVNNTECHQIVIVNNESNEKVNKSSKLAINSTSKQNIYESSGRSRPKPTKIKTVANRINTPLLEDNIHDITISELTKRSRGGPRKIGKIVNSSNVTSHEGTLKSSKRTKSKSFFKHNACDNIFNEPSKRPRSAMEKIGKIKHKFITKSHKKSKDIHIETEVKLFKESNITDIVDIDSSSSGEEDKATPSSKSCSKSEMKSKNNESKGEKEIASSSSTHCDEAKEDDTISELPKRPRTIEKIVSSSNLTSHDDNTIKPSKKARSKSFQPRSVMETVGKTNHEDDNIIETNIKKHAFVTKSQIDTEDKLFKEANITDITDIDSSRSDEEAKATSSSKSCSKSEIKSKNDKSKDEKERATTSSKAKEDTFKPSVKVLAHLVQRLRRRVN